MPRPAGNRDQMWSLCFTRHVCTGHRMTLAIFSSVGKRGSTHIITHLRETYRVSLSKIPFPSPFPQSFFHIFSFCRAKVKKLVWIRIQFFALILHCVNFYDQLKNIYIYMTVYLKIIRAFLFFKILHPRTYFALVWIYFWNLKSPIGNAIED